ncbi:MAG: valyl-tRNA synthetase [Sulfuricurvum sp. PC08-66]|nr:MAG: valyl-tRNA synthetase [Sulfuricurvum sp. PC08-66]
MEQSYYAIWQARKLFELEGNRAIQQEGKTFSIMMPPPNVTGVLHIGHALTFTLQDIIVRYKRMDGYATLWQPGMDHAGIATENIVLKKLLKAGLSKESLGREKFLEHVWEWKEEHGGKILNQLKMLGTSANWERTRFTYDAGLQKAVRKAFVELYNKGHIVRGNYMVNWCTNDGALSDIEVEHKEEKGALYHIRYPIKDANEVLVVATTRPETYFGDTAVMVHPDDARYTHLIGKSVLLPLIDKEVKIIADAHVDMTFGTGVVKVTPAHDTNDYEVGKRHNLDFITIFDEKGILNSHCYAFEGLERKAARTQVVEALQAGGFIEKIEEHIHQVGHCYRCDNVIEPYISKQWFLKKEVASEAIARVNAGETKFFPASWKNNYDAWMNELRDWCISRQLWWGHRIPVFYCDHCGHEWASDTEIEHACPKCQSTNIYQDPDVLDTWFSSALWPFSTLGWGNEDDAQVGTEDMKRFYPNSLLITGFDILFFWVARMLMMGVEFNHVVPFKDVYLHALVRDEHGNKMSKSKGNVIDPLDMIEEFSTDALRFTMAALAVQGRDIKLGRTHLEQYRNFTNKLFNAANFLQMNATNFADLAQTTVVTPLGRYMLSRFHATVAETRKHLDEYRFNDAATGLYRFLWNEFCAWGIELAKADKASIPELGAIYKESMRLTHPFMPYITEYLYHSLSGSALEEGAASIMVSRYPAQGDVDSAIEKTFAIIMDAIVSIRRAKAIVDLGGTIPTAYVRAQGVDTALAAPFIERLAKVEKVTFVTDKVADAMSDVGEYCEVYIPKGDIDFAPIITRLENQKLKLDKEIAKLDGMLSNERFVANAPQNVLESNRQALAEANEKMNKIDAQLLSLKA